MGRSIKPSLEVVQKFLDYDPDTGIFSHKRTGKKAGYVTGKGQLAIEFGPFRCHANKLAWLFVYGEYPKFRLGFRDGNKLNNVFTNIAPYEHIRPCSMPTAQPVTADDWRALFTYNPENGDFRWKVKPNWQMEPGDPAGAMIPTARQYMVGVLGRRYSVRKIIWIMMTGADPRYRIFARDGNPMNLKWANLYDAPHREGMWFAWDRMNKRPKSDLPRGICLRTKGSIPKYEVRVGEKYLGSYEAFSDALVARRQGLIAKYGHDLET